MDLPTELWRLVLQFADCGFFFRFRALSLLHFDISSCWSLPIRLCHLLQRKPQFLATSTAHLSLSSVIASFLIFYSVGCDFIDVRSVDPSWSGVLERVTVDLTDWSPDTISALRSLQLKHFHLRIKRLDILSLIHDLDLHSFDVDLSIEDIDTINAVNSVFADRVTTLRVPTSDIDFSIFPSIQTLAVKDWIKPQNLTVQTLCVEKFNSLESGTVKVTRLHIKLASEVESLELARFIGVQSLYVNAGSKRHRLNVDALPELQALHVDGLMVITDRFRHLRKLSVSRRSRVDSKITAQCIECENPRVLQASRSVVRCVTALRNYPHESIPALLELPATCQLVRIDKSTLRQINDESIALAVIDHQGLTLIDGGDVRMVMFRPAVYCRSEAIMQRLQEMTISSNELRAWIINAQLDKLRWIRQQTLRWSIKIDWHEAISNYAIGDEVLELLTG